MWRRRHARESFEGARLKPPSFASSHTARYNAALMATHTSSTATPSKGHLLRIVGVGFGIAVSIGGTVGSGILRTPGEIAAQLRNPWLILAVWIFGGIYAFYATVAVSELATMLPREGGWYVNSREAFGEYAGFLVGSCDWIMQTVAISYLSVAFGEFSAGLVPALGPQRKLVSVSAVIALTILNWLGQIGRAS